MSAVQFANRPAGGPPLTRELQLFRLIAICIGLLLLPGCASQPGQVSRSGEATAVSPSASDSQESWWYVRFRLHWPDGEEPPWYPDLLLADRVIRPVLEAERDAIGLWRFHRRAARDQAGRQFSFIYRATPDTAARINADIAADPWIGRLRQRGLLEAVAFDDPARPKRPNVRDTSDPSWSPAMQAAWPHFIMGVSHLWLQLIREIERRESWPRDPLARYAAIERTLDEHWRSEGGHALLHHLSAVFG